MVHIQTSAPHSVADFFHGIGAGIMNFMTSIVESNSRLREIERLNAMNDAELAEIGLKREDIVRHVFRDRFYI